MTAVKLLKDSSGRLCGYEVSGHTGFAQSGKDIVCSALSFLSITCANALETVAGKSPAIQMKDAQGYLKVTLPAQELTAHTDAIFGVFQQGISDLMAAYPTYIKTI